MVDVFALFLSSLSSSCSLCSMFYDVCFVLSFLLYLTYMYQLWPQCDKNFWLDHSGEPAGLGLCVLWSSTFQIVLKPKNASPQSLKHGHSKWQQLLHLHIIPPWTTSSGLTERMDSPESWIQRHDVYQDTLWDNLRQWSQPCDLSMTRVWLTLLRARWQGRHTEWHK